MSSLQQLMSETERLLILRILKEASGYCANESIIDRSMDLWGNSISRDKVRAHLTWLEEQEVVSLEEMSGYLVATLRQRGLDLTEGTCTLPGVARPGPRT
tara:strand:- start:3414 stop:3713 length:300 start_codon:yes stop_codon:yes gene_type:complete